MNSCEKTVIQIEEKVSKEEILVEEEMIEDQEEILEVQVAVAMKDDLKDLNMVGVITLEK